MSQLSEIESVQRALEENFNIRMAELEALMQSGGPDNAVAKVAEECPTFREFVITILGLLRHQISECHRSVDIIEITHTRKSFLFLSMAKAEKEDCASVILDNLHSNLGLKNIVITDLGDIFCCRHIRS